MEISTEVKSKIDDKNIDKVLTKSIEENCKENGYPLCGSRNTITGIPHVFLQKDLFFQMVDSGY